MNCDSVHSFQFFVSFEHWREMQARIEFLKERIKHIFTKAYESFILPGAKRLGGLQ